MSKNLIIAIVVISLAAGGYFYSRSKQDSMMPKDVMTKEDQTVKTDDAMMKKEDAMMDENKVEGSDKMMKKTSRYQSFTKSVLADVNTNRRVLYFYASWCPSCIPANADFEKNASKLPSDLTVIRVNYNDPDTDADEKALASKYAITYQHTFVQIDKAGEVVTKWNGGALTELLAKIK